MARIYTRTGDEGETGLFGGERVPKSHRRVQAYGAVDELNAVIGLVLAGMDPDDDGADRLRGVQPDLFDIGAHLATPPETRGRRPELPSLPDARIAEFESWIDDALAELPDLRSFVLPGGTSTAAALHLARTVCRRAERRVVELAEADAVEPSVLRYLNRLSDYLFMAARLANHRAGRSDVPWVPVKQRPGAAGGETSADA